MSAVAALVVTAVLAGIAAVQVLGAAGRPVGHLLWGGRHRVLPRGLRIGSAVSVLLYVGFAAVLLSRAGVLPGGGTGFVVVTSWVLTGYFALGVLMNGVSRSRGERAVMTPACAIMAVGAMVVSLAP